MSTILHESRETSAVDRRVGEHVASLVEDGSCLQMGIGAIPDAGLACLGDRKDLGVHTEMFSDGVLDLLESGVVNNARKKIARGRVVTSFAMGSRRLYDYVNDNPEVTFLDVEYVNNPVVIAKNKKVMSINSAIQVDLTGQVCADSMGHRIYSGVGGQVDYVVTEYGVAELRGRSLNERAADLIAIAHPDFRESLAREARDSLGLRV